MRLETDRLIIRNFEEHEIDKVYQIDSNESVMKYITEGITLPWEESKKRLASFIEGYQEQTGLGIWLVEIKENKEFLGRASLLKNNNLDLIEVGYRFLPKYWRMGFGTEVVSSLSMYAKDVLGLNDIYAMTHQENLPSAKLLDKMGFSLIDTVSTYVPIPKKHIDAHLYRKNLLLCP